MDKGKMEWFCNAKYGVFIHWGLYALPGGEWQGRHVPSGTEWIMRNAKISYAEYSLLMHRFSPTNFDADDWVRRIKSYGAGYICFTAKHHDGFAMYDSKVSDYSTMHTPFGRDVLKELSAACTKYQMPLCVYYSQMQDWADPDGDGNTWDYAPEKKDFQRYFYGKVVPQVTELLTRYGKIGMIWFDTPYDMPIELCRELRELVKTLQADCIINGRIGYGLGDYRQMSDNCIPTHAYPGPWETPLTLNDTWGYSTTDKNWKAPSEVIGRLVDVTAKGGNLLLNIGPDATGSIPPESDQIMQRVGSWLAANGESIRGTTPCIEMPYVLPFGGCTARPGHLYLHVLKYPQAPFQIMLCNLQIEILQVTLLADGRSVPFVQTYEPARNEDRLRIVLPEDPPDAVDTVIDIAYSGKIACVPLDMLDTMYL